jgi:hypothetical protein
LVDLGPSSTPRWASLSVDPGATALEALKWSGYACALSAAAGWRAKHRSIGLVLLVFGAALLVCFVTLAHGVLNLERIYGFFRPTDGSRWVRGPFVNGNNLAGYLNLGLFTGAGLAVSKRFQRGTPALLVAIVFLGAGSLLASSRAGTVALILGVALFTFLVLRQRRESRQLVLIVSAIGAMGLAVAAILSGRRVFSTLLDTQMQAKVSVWRWSLDLIGDFPVFGVGRGGFENAFPPYRHPLPSDYGNIDVHVESFPLQWAADWGIPVAVGALVLLGLAARRTLRRTKGDPASAGLFTGLAVLFLQNSADLGLELFAVSIAAVVAFAALDEPPEPAPSPAALGLGPAPAMVAVAVVVTLALGAAPPQVERRTASRAYAALGRSSATELRAFKLALEPIIRRHPGDAFLPLLGGLATERLGADPLPWFGRALERAPFSAATHLALSDTLAARNARAQSLLHARLAAFHDRGLRDRALARIASRARDRRDLEDAFPAGLPASELLASTCALLLPSLRVDCQRLVLERRPSPDSERALAATLVVALERRDPPCGDATRRCLDEAFTLLDRLETQQKDKDPALSELRARLMSLDGRKSEAAALLLEHCTGGSDDKACFERALDLATEAGDANAIDAVTARYAPLVCADSAACGALHERVGRIYARLSADATALRHFLAAAKASPSAERWVVTAETATRVGASSTAALALDRASREAGLSGEHRSRIAATKAKLDGPALE